MLWVVSLSSILEIAANNLRDQRSIYVNIDPKVGQSLCFGSWFGGEVIRADQVIVPPQKSLTFTRSALISHLTGRFSGLLEGSDPSFHSRLSTYLQLNGPDLNL
jgi:hypothetical protein